MFEARPVWAGGAALGEGPAWDPRTNVLWFVDIKAPRVHRYDPATGAVEAWDAPAAVGWVLPADDGALLCGLRTGIARFDPATAAFGHVADVERHLPGNRLNDAIVGHDGIVWFGSMDDGETEASGRVYRWDGARVAATDIAPVCITNGPGLSPDGRTLYHVDTVGGTIHAFDVDDAGGVGAARVFARIDPALGHPDGVTVDSQGNVWVGLWGGWRARLYDPDGHVLLDVPLPVANVTKVALGGPALRTAYVTTARVGLDAGALADQPLAGALFSFEVEVPGRHAALARSAGRRQMTR